MCVCFCGDGKTRACVCAMPGGPALACEPGDLRVRGDLVARGLLNEACAPLRPTQVSASPPIRGRRSLWLWLHVLTKKSVNTLD